MVPALTHSVKVEGFVLISQVLDTAATQPHPPSLINLVDGVFLREGILRFNETIDM